ncbi:hypothetical protein HDU67_000110 [Dinochytrium kinnereticum]|nr:hypothetical protein HDU67_000110 [Dinochytrium kinnereticum]
MTGVPLRLPAAVPAGSFGLPPVLPLIPIAGPATMPLLSTFLRSSCSLYGSGPDHMGHASTRCWVDFDFLFEARPYGLIFRDKMDPVATGVFTVSYNSVAIAQDTELDSTKISGELLKTAVVSPWPSMGEVSDAGSSSPFLSQEFGGESKISNEVGR